MHYRRLGRTGLNLSVLSLGSGGPNQFGQLRYVSRSNIHALVRRALDLGVNYFDTASGYSHSESILGEALQGIPRSRYLLSSKIFPLHQGEVISAAQARALVERSLRRLGVDTLDILYFHRVPPEFYEATVERLMPTMRALQAEGLIRFTGITESSKRDRSHRMLELALRDDYFDTIMVGYGIGHTAAEREVLPLAMAKDVGVTGMAAARDLVPQDARSRWKLFQRALLSLATSPPGPGKLNLRLRAAYSSVFQSGSPGSCLIAREHGMDFLELPAAAYTFALSHPALATVLTGTTDPMHLEQNIRAALVPALTAREIDQFRQLLEERTGFE